MVQRMAAYVLILLLSLSVSAVFAAEAKKPAGTKKPVAEKRTAAGRVYTSLIPQDGSMINNARPTISAEYLDEGIGINPQDTKIYLDGMDVTSQAQATANKVVLTPAQPLSEGLHKVKVDIDDKAGNPASVIWSFTLQTQAPKIKITSHKANQYINQSPISVTGTVDNVKARVLVNGIVAAVDRGAFNARVNIVEGNNTVTAVATDPFGNTGTDAVTVVLDSKPPTAQITSPLANSLLNTRTATVSGIADAKAATVVVTTAAGTQPVTAVVANGSFTASNVVLAEGANTITAKAVSNAGNTGTSIIRVIVDTIAPRVTLTAPKDKMVTNKRMITVAGAIDDTAAVVKVNNTPVQVAKGGFTLSGVNLAEGSNTITATATDRAGNQAKPATLTVILKTVPPAAPKLGDLPFVTKDTSVLVSGTAEPGSQVELFMNSSSRGSVKADEKGAFSFKAPLREGNNAFSAVASDAVGNISASSAVVNVFLDTKPPQIL